MTNPMYRFEPTDEVRCPKAGEWFLCDHYDDSVLTVRFEKAIFDYTSSAVPIYRRVPHDPDTAAMVAFLVKLANDRDDCISPGLQREAIQLLEALKGTP